MGLLRGVLGVGPAQARDLVAYSPWMATPNVTEAGADRAITGAWDPIMHRYEPYSPESIRDARTLLARAGYQQGLSLQTYALNNSPFRREEAQFLAKDWGQIGVRLDLEGQAGQTPCSYLLAPLQIGDFQVALFAWADDFRAESLRSELQTYNPGIPARPGRCTEPDRGENYAGISDRQIDLAWKKAESITDTAQRNALYRRIQERVIKQAYWIPLYWRPAITAVSLRVKGFGQSGDLATWRPQDWRLSP
jgi:ABC-type transport system substrate-binding protein